MNRKRQFQEETSASGSLAEKLVKRSIQYDDSSDDTDSSDLDNELSNELDNQLINSLDNDVEGSSSDPPQLSNDNSQHSNGNHELVFSPPNNESVCGFLFNEESRYDWDARNESQFIKLNEQVDWIYNNHEKLFDRLEYPESTFDQLDLDRQYEFVDQEIYDAILKCKSALNRFSKEEIRRAKSDSNPFESISKCIFQNRSALKMANLDWLCNYMFSSPRIEDKADRLNFVDLCGGPGGFTEYILFKRQWEARGFGFTLKAENDFNLDKLSSTSEFHKFYGDLGDGDITRPKNLVSLRNYVLNNTERRGVHVVLSDGAFSCLGRERFQELLSRRLQLCQFVCALSILKKGGNFVCKLFDIYSVFSVGLIYLMYRCFSQMAIIKPNTSRPANSERYIVFKSKLDNCESIENFLFKINCSLDSFELALKQDLEGQSPPANEYSSLIREDFHQLIPLETIKADHAFYDYIRNSNNMLGKRQIHFLCKERAFAANSSLVDNRKNNLRRKCLSIWKIPSRLPAPSNCNPTAEQKFESLMKEFNINISKCAFLYYESSELKQLSTLKYPWNYMFTTLTENRDNDSQRGIFQSLKGLIYFFDTQSNQWKLVKQLEKLRLPDNTIVYAELTSEFKGEGTSQKKILALHIIDSLILGNINVCNRPIEERIMMTEKMLKFASLDNLGNFFVRCKRYHRLPEIESFFQELEMKECKGIRKERICLPTDGEHFAIASGLQICSALKRPFGSNKSNSTDKIYYFNYKSNSASVFKCPLEAINDFVTNYCERLTWKWTGGQDLLPTDESNQPTSNHPVNVNRITRQSFRDYLDNKNLRPK